MTIIKKPFQRDLWTPVTKTFSKPSRAKQSFKDECDINSIMAKWQKTGVMFGDDFQLESVSEAVRQMMSKLKTHGFSVNGSTEQTWFTSKEEHYKKFEKMCPGINTLV